MNANGLKEKRVGVMLHYSAGAFTPTVRWCEDPKSQVSYNTVIGPHGEIAYVVPYHLRAWHAGKCQPSDPKRLPYTDANSAFEGIALSGGPPTPPTAAQVKHLVRLIRERFAANGWDLRETWRITSHHLEAWPRGRKQDVVGPKPNAPWLDLNAIREEVAR